MARGAVGDLGWSANSGGLSNKIEKKNTPQKFEKWLQKNWKDSDDKYIDVEEKGKAENDVLNIGSFIFINDISLLAGKDPDHKQG